jgi:potassium-transporting ATPase KdpC subunit
MTMFQELSAGFRMMVVMTILTGFVYPGVVTALTQVLFRSQANGSLIVSNGQVIGSRLIGQNFTKPEYFQPRPSAAGSGYDPTATAGSNFGPTNQKLVDRVKASVEKYRKDNPDYRDPIPSDAVTASSSGLDPHISPSNAHAQAERVANGRGIPVDQVHDLIARHTEGRDLGFLGEPRVNVLELNLALDAAFPRK